MPETEVAASPVLMEKDSETQSLKEIGQEKKELPKEEKSKEQKESESSEENDENSSEVAEEKKDDKKKDDVKMEEKKDEKKDERKNNLAEIEFAKEARNRVKLYVLCEQRVWDDRGTGHVTCVPIPDSNEDHCIIVRLESNEKNVLESKIQMDTVYQKQQETLIVWSESDSCDLALSFQEKSGCEEIWAKICFVQGRDPEDGGYEDLEEGEVSDGGQAGTSGTTTQNARGCSISLPPCEMSRLNEIEALLQNHLQTSTLREKISNSIESENYISKLCDLFRMCEDVENVEGLRTFYLIAKHLFMLNRNSIVDMLFAEDCVKEVIGMLEYDPSLQEPRKHREFLFEKTKFKDVLKIERPELRDRIRHTYHVQYVQDVCLPAPSIFEENLLAVLNSHIFFCRVEIVGMLMDEKNLLRDMFAELKDDATPVSRKADLAKFLREFCSFSQALQNNGSNSRDTFFKALTHNDVLGTLEPCLRSPDVETRSTIIEMLLMMVEYNQQNVRDYLLRQAKDRPEEEILLNLLINHMLHERDAELSSAEQVAQVLRTLLDPDNMVAHKTEKSEFLTFFYRKCINTLCKPILNNVQGGNLQKDDYYTANVSCLVVRLLCFCVEHHAYNMRSHCLSSGLLAKVLVLLKSRHHFLALGALKMLRGVCSLKDDFYFRDIVKNCVLDKVVECFVRNGPRYNLLNSAIIELFDFLRMEDVKSLIKYTVEKHWVAFEKVRYVTTFDQIKMRYEQYLDRERPQEPPKETVIEAKVSKERQIDAEEQWFSNEDDDEPTSERVSVAQASVGSEGPARKQGEEPMYPSVKRKVDEDDDQASVFSGGSSQVKRPSPTPQIKIVRPRSPPRSAEDGFTTSRQQSEGGSQSPSSLAREDEVSSSQPGSKESSPQANSTALKTLSEYGSDSDSDNEDSVPADPPVGDSSREDDVTSTSGSIAGTKRRRSESLDSEPKRPRSESPEEKQK